MGKTKPTKKTAKKAEKKCDKCVNCGKCVEECNKTSYTQAMGISDERTTELMKLVVEVKMSTKFPLRSDEASEIIKHCRTQREIFFCGNFMKSVETKLEKIASCL